MSETTLREALAPIASRMPRIVREHEILRISASIGGKDPVKAAQAACREVLIWAQKRSGGRLPTEAWDLQSFEYFSGGRNSIAIRIGDHNPEIWSIRTDDPDKNEPGRTWTTEVVVGLMKDQPAQFSARLLASTHEDWLDIEPHSPGFVQQVVDTCGLVSGPYELSATPWVIESDFEADQLIEMLLNPLRRLPVFVLTVPEKSQDEKAPILDADVLARATLGLAHVAVVPAAHTWSLSNRFGKFRSVFGGAVRAYLPGFTEDADPYGHRLVLAENIGTPEGSKQCVRWMRSLAAAESIRRARLGHEVLAFADIRNAALKLKQERLEQEGASDSVQLDAAKAHIKSLEKQVEEQQGLQDYFSDEHKKAEARAEGAERQLNAAAFRVQQLLDQLKARGESPDTNIELPRTWGEFSEWCDTHLVGRVTLTPAARRSVKSPEFEDIQLAARCLLWLANDCRNWRMEGGKGSLREEMVEDGIRNAHCGGDAFDVDWQGQRHTADWHIKNGGNTRDPKRCLRIYYFWDSATQQIVVAEMPAHRRTGAT